MDFRWRSVFRKSRRDYLLYRYIRVQRPDSRENCPFRLCVPGYRIIAGRTMYKCRVCVLAITQYMLYICYKIYYRTERLRHDNNYNKSGTDAQSVARLSRLSRVFAVNRCTWLTLPATATDCTRTVRYNVLLLLWF